MKRSSIEEEQQEPILKQAKLDISCSELEKLEQQVLQEFENESEQEGEDEEGEEGDQQHTIVSNDDDQELFYSGEESQGQDSDEEDGELSKQELNARRLAVFETLSGSQLDRYECYRRASFQKSKMTRVMRYILRQNVNERMIISMQGIAKLFVGELVECARKVANDRGESGPLKPAHFHAAYQILYREGKIPVLAEKR
eukprot:TRINITY_DN5673_c0_g2_i4.p1 TRINITY_DN5673_c0_g2~~TRINITY_DN5673_c0_g2_i4.p1  ORF type:complete len:199 (-),score=48.24 TRINITY_DN5673_c0_g2_i4:225-821(-)